MGGKGSGVNATGRKRKSEGGRVSFIVSCSAEQRENIKEKAQALKMTVSDLVLESVSQYQK